MTENVMARLRAAAAAATLAGLMVGPSDAWGNQAVPGGALIREIRIAESDGDTAVTIAAGGRPTFTTYVLERPARVVVDISGARLGNVEVPFDAGTFAVGAVSASFSQDEAGARTRVVLGLRQPASYRVEARAGDIIVRVSPYRRAPTGAAEAVRPSDERMRYEAAHQAAEKARADAATAQQAASAERTRAERALHETHAARAEIDRQREALLRAELELRKVEQEAGDLRRRADATEKQAEAARLREEGRSRALRAAAELVEARRKALEEKLASQEAERTRLQEAGSLVGERERGVQAAAAELAARQKAFEQAAARHARAGADASESQRARLAREVAEAERQRREALQATRLLREELEQAVAARKAIEAKKLESEKERSHEEQRLAQAVAARNQEEIRRAAAEQARRKEEERLAKAEAVRAKMYVDLAKLGAERDALLADLRRRKSAPVAPVPMRALAPAEVRPTGADADSGSRPRSVTLRAPSRVQRIEFIDEPARSSVIIDLEEPSLFSVERVTGRRMTMRLLHAELPRELERSLDATEYLGPVRVISSYRDPAARASVRVDVDLAEDVPNQVRRDGNRLYWEFRKAGRVINRNMGMLDPPRPGEGAASSVSFIPAPKLAGFRAEGAMLWRAQAAGSHGGNTVGRKRYLGRRIDLDFKAADIHNILRLLADVGQVNIVVADEVKGDVTIKMRDVPWDQALDVVLRSKLLGSVREGNLIRVASLSVLEKELEQEIARQKQITDVLPTETRLIGVSYAEATALESRAKDLLSARGKISVDARTNNLIVSDVAKNLALIEELVRNLDTQTSQVVIEGRIVEARSTFNRQFGIQWGGTAFLDADHSNPTGLTFPYNVGIGGGSGAGAIAGLVPAARSGLASASPNFVVNMPAPAGENTGAALGFTFGSVAGAFNLNLRLSAAESTGQVRILSSPRVTTMDNVEASISQGVAIPISVVSAAGAQTVFVDAILNLQVKPHVTNEGTVMLHVSVTRNEPDFGNTGARGDPTILKKEARTQMLVRDGDTAVIGGIYTRNSGLNFQKVPFFADLPVLGALFRSRRENDDRSEFLVFITPRIANRARALGQ